MWDKILPAVNVLVSTVSTPNISPLPKVEPGDSTVKIVLNVVFAITGSISLLVITIAGLRYIVSHGSPQEVAKAKNAIIYALVGLVITIMAATIVNFVARGLF